MVSQPHDDKPSVAGRFLRLLKTFGPGIITGAADDDPSGIATYSQTGAQFGFGQLWTALYQIPLLLAVQEACARIGAVTGKGSRRRHQDALFAPDPDRRWCCWWWWPTPSTSAPTSAPWPRRRGWWSTSLLPCSRSAWRAGGGA